MGNLSPNGSHSDSARQNETTDGLKSGNSAGGTHSFGHGWRIRERFFSWNPLAGVLGDGGKAGAQNPMPSRREWFIVAFAFASLSASVVMLGALRVTGQFVSLGLSAVAFLFLFFPMFDGGRSQGAMESLRKLVRFPLFWLGLALLALMLVQGMNPERLVVARTYSYRILRPDRLPVSWLPSGLDAPYDMSFAPGGMNAFRQMVMFGGPWLLLCALWAGLRRARAFAALGWGILLFGFVFAAYGVWLRIEGVQEFFNYYTQQEASFFSTFPYQNNAGAWLSLAFAVAVALGLWHWGRAEKVRAPSGPHLMCAAFALSFALASVCTLSFGGMLTLGVLLLVATPATILWLLWRKGVRRNTILGGAVASALLALLALFFYGYMDLHSVEAKLQRKFNLVETNRVDDRKPFRQATWSMVEYRNYEHLWSGWGAGSYQWLSQPFLQRHPAFQPTARNAGGRSHHVHCDWLEMLVEWGVLGVSIVAMAFLWMAGHLLRRWRRWTPVTLVLVAAVLLYMGHSWMDFLNYSMPLLGLLAFVVVLAAKFSLSPAPDGVSAVLSRRRGRHGDSRHRGREKYRENSERHSGSSSSRKHPSGTPRTDAAPPHGRSEKDPRAPSAPQGPPVEIPVEFLGGNLPPSESSSETLPTSDEDSSKKDSRSKRHSRRRHHHHRHHRHHGE